MIKSLTTGSNISGVLQEAHVESLIDEALKDFIYLQAIRQLSMRFRTRVFETSEIQYERDFADALQSYLHWPDPRLETITERALVRAQEVSDSNRVASIIESKAHLLLIASTPVAIKLGLQWESGIENYLAFIGTSLTIIATGVFPEYGANIIRSFRNLYDHRRLMELKMDGEFRVRDFIDQRAVLEYIEREQLATDPKLMLAFIRNRLPVMQKNLLQPYLDELEKLQKTKSELLSILDIITNDENLVGNAKAKRIKALKDEIDKYEALIASIVNKISILNEFFRLTQKGADEIEAKIKEREAIAEAEILTTMRESVPDAEGASPEVTVVSLTADFGSLFSQVIHRLEAERILLEDAAISHPDDILSAMIEDAACQQNNGNSDGSEIPTTEHAVVEEEEPVLAEK